MNGNPILGMGDLRSYRHLAWLVLAEVASEYIYAEQRSTHWLSNEWELTVVTVLWATNCSTGVLLSLGQVRVVNCCSDSKSASNHNIIPSLAVFS